jgi:hypothetical protein
MLDPSFHSWLMSLASLPSFIKTTCQTEQALRRQAGVELALRFLAFRYVPYKKGLDVHEYLDQALIELATRKNFDRKSAEANFVLTFETLFDVLGSKAFKRWNGKSFSGKFLMSVFEIMSLGVSKRLESILALGEKKSSLFLVSRAKDLWGYEPFVRNSGAGIRGTTRLENLLPKADAFFKP